jgi:N-acetylglucosamine kinase-like BadF-type ATPase
MQSFDGRGPETGLLPVLQQRLGAAEPSDLINILYDAEMSRDRIAACAESVFEIAGDPTAAAIIALAANDLATMVATLAQRLGLTADRYPLAITGSLLLKQEPLRRAVLEQLTPRAAIPGSVTLVAEPVRGAVALARRLAAEA